MIFDPNGREIVKRRGYIPPERMARLLDAVVADPSPIKYTDQASVESYSTTHLLPEDLRKKLKHRLLGSHDFTRGGPIQEQKFLDRDTIEYAIMSARKAAHARCRSSTRRACWRWPRGWREEAVDNAVLDASGRHWFPDTSSNRSARP